MADQQGVLEKIKAVLPNRLSWSEFLRLHSLFKTSHPEHWDIEWARLPLTSERTELGEPVYHLSFPGEEPERVVVYDETKLVASKDRHNFWETFDRDNLGRITNYQNALGCQMSLHWGSDDAKYPVQRIEHGYCWVLVASSNQDAIYWCPKTDYFHAYNILFSRSDLNTWMSNSDWGDRELLDMVNKALSMPFTRLGRSAWQLKNPPIEK